MNPVLKLSAEMTDSSETIRLKGMIQMAYYSNSIILFFSSFFFAENRICSTAGAAVLENQSFSGNRATDFPSITT